MQLLETGVDALPYLLTVMMLTMLLLVSVCEIQRLRVPLVRHDRVHDTLHLRESDRVPTARQVQD